MKKVLSILFGLSCVVTVISINQSKKLSQYSDITLENIEALSQRIEDNPDNPYRIRSFDGTINMDGSLFQYKDCHEWRFLINVRTYDWC